MRPEDVPTLKAWMEEQRGATAFNVQLATGAQMLVVYDDEGPLMFVPFWVSLTAGCPLQRGGSRPLSECGDDALHIANGFRLATKALRFLADSQGVVEVNTATTDEE